MILGTGGVLRVDTDGCRVPVQFIDLLGTTLGLTWSVSDSQISGSPGRGTVETTISGVSSPD